MPTQSFNPLLSIVIPAYNPREHVRIIIETLAAQYAQNSIEAIIVDDGSEPAINFDFKQLPSTIHFDILRLPQNTGRAGALNAGINKSSGQFITFLDVDCIPEPHFLINVIKHIKKEIPLFFGHIRFCSTDSYFDDYCNNIQRHRYLDINNWEMRLTSANVTVRRDLIESINGFNRHYQHYGFEDRDLFIRLKEAFPNLHPEYLMSCCVKHVDTLCIEDIVKKFWLSGRYTADIFRKDHPQEYRQMPQHYFDAQYHLFYRFFPPFILHGFASSGHFIFNRLFFIGRRLGWRWLSDITLKFLSGLAFLRGTLNQSNCA
ncbi:MAG: glycosyltransferase family 2 protein [Deltaproteobacteria bacterium]|nr:glycosyltransferase family 2 protein [Deltaproteobacteria bacterium]